MNMENVGNQSLGKLLDLTGKVAIVTGGAVGIGRGIACRLAEAGAKVVIADRTQEAANRTVAECLAKGWTVKAISADVSVEEEVKHLVDETVSTFGQIDILVNNAGIYPVIPLTETTLEDFEKVINTNLRGVFLCTKYVSEKMIARNAGGRILNITSIDAIHPSMVGLASYDASKHGVWGFTKNVALELAPYKIWVNAIAPGGINTPGVRKLQGGAVSESFLAGIPMHRMGEPDEIGKVALFLVSEMASYMTGSQVIVDGGFLLS